ncbi:rolling circle replication-associated protein, partial [Turicibacter sanguinis]
MSKKQRRLKPYDQYDYENTYDKPFDEITGEFIGAVVKPPKGVSYTTNTIKSGNQFEVEIFPAFKRDIPHFIKKEKKETRQAQKNLNDRNAKKKIMRLVHENFYPGDYFCTLTFKNEDLPNGLDDAERLSKNFFRRINRLRKKLNLENAKYVYVLEEGTYGTQRFHLHLIMDNGLSKEEVEEKWGHG